MRCLICGASHASCKGAVMERKVIELPRRKVMENKTDFVSDRRLYLDKDGNVVGADDPNKLTLLVAEGGRLSAEDAAKYGLTSGAEEEDGEAEGNEESDGEVGAEGGEEPAARSAAKKSAKKGAKK